MSLISVIMPAYNAQAYITSSSNSVISQTYTNWELIVVNDGSKDNTLEIINILAQTDKRIKVISQDNQGQTAARNTGLEHAIGEYVTFLDSDDLFQSTYLEKMLQRIQTGNCDAVYCGLKNMKEKNNIGEPYAEGNLLICYALHNQHISIICFFIKKEFLDKNHLNFVSGRKIGGDQEFIIMCGVYNCIVKAVPEVLVQYTYNTQSVTGHYISWSKYKDDYAARSRVYELIQESFDSPHKEAVCQYFYQKKQRVLISFKKNLWSSLKIGQIDLVYQDMCEYGHLENFETRRKFIHSVEVAILNTKNKTLWKLIATPLRVLKNVELMLTGKKKSKV